MRAGRSSQPTIADVAAAAGVSKMTVSLTMNGRPGVSDATRERVRLAAQELGWIPDPTARSLAGARPDSVGLVLCRPPGTFRSSTFYLQLIAGMESELSARSHSLVLHVTADPEAEKATYRMLARTRRVDAVLVTDVLDDDDRAPLLAELGLRAVALAGPGTQFPTLMAQDIPIFEDVLEHLAERGHRVVARIGGQPELHYSRKRTAAFVAGARSRGIVPVVVDGIGAVSDPAGTTRELLTRDQRPTALVLDSDTMALGAVSAIRDLGLRMPDDVAVVSWDGSDIADALSPRLTTVRRDVAALGALAARALMAADPAPIGPLPNVLDAPRPRLVVAETT